MGCTTMGVVDLDEDSRYRAVMSRDRRFDGWFFVGVSSTGIFCRPSCPATTPKRSNVHFYPSAAAARGAGYRACRRCRPDTAPGSPAWNVRGDLVSRAMAMIDDGVVDRDGVTGLAQRLAVSERHLHRILVEELGAPPVALARTRRAQTARILIETTDLPFSAVAFAAGFASIRQFNDTVREFFGATPTTLRADRAGAIRRGRAGEPGEGGGPGASSGTAPVSLRLRLAARLPFCADDVISFLRTRAIAGVEAAPDDGSYVRSLRLPHGPATVALHPAVDHIRADLVLGDLRDLGSAVARCRRLCDLDADPIAIDGVLGSDPLLQVLVTRRPGRRSPGAVDGTEIVVRAIAGQQVSVAGARTVVGRIVERWGDPLPASMASAGVDRTFPSAAAIAAADPALLSMPRSRAGALIEACHLIAAGGIDLDPGADRAHVERSLLAVRGIGPWTTAYVAMRALGDPDVFLPTDVGVLRGLEHLGGPTSPGGAAAASDGWRPWRSYAVHHLWAGG